VRIKIRTSTSKKNKRILGPKFYANTGPGPGSYNPVEIAHPKHINPSPGFATRKKHNIFGSQLKQPGPGYYNPRDELVVNGISRRSYNSIFKSESERTAILNFVDSPPPGHYTIKRDLADIVNLNKVSPGFYLPPKVVERPEDLLIKYNLKPNPKAKDFPGPGTYSLKSDFELIGHNHTGSHSVLLKNGTGADGVGKSQPPLINLRKKNLEEKDFAKHHSSDERPFFKEIERRTKNIPGPGSYISNDHGGMARVAKSIVKDSAFRSEVERDMYGMKESNILLAPGRYDPQKPHMRESFHLNRGGIWMS
jgi:hypothetical protein